MSQATTPTNSTYKIIIVSGQEFSVPIETDNEAIRKQLAAQFPDVASATIKEGTKTVKGVEIQTIEFVKKAGTKGLGHVELADILGNVPSVEVTTTPRDNVLLARLVTEDMTFGEALESWRELHQALFSVINDPRDPQTEEKRLCRDIDALPATAGVPFGW